jgi:MoaA/NifB/PqqE/SkfB family radical SAM enzyme
VALGQVFLYVTQKCNIRCVTCYALDQLERHSDLSEHELVAVLEKLRAKGAWKLSFLGGEPTVHPRLREIAVSARALGYRFVRVNTNGMIPSAWLRAESTKAIDVFCFSVDGSTSEINDAIRKGSRLDRVVANMQLAAALGFDVRANMTVTSANLHQIRDVIALVRNCGASEVNLNVMFQMGYAADRADLCVDPARWRAVYDDLIANHDQLGVRLKIPKAFASSAELAGCRHDGHRCLAAEGSRVYVSSNGDAYPCLTMMGDEGWRVGDEVDARLAADSVHDYCHFIKMRSDEFRPLCIFHKARLNG